MNVIGITNILERNGWLHEITFLIDDKIVIITDDSGEVNVSASTADAITTTGALTIWKDFKFGEGTFPAQPIPDSLPSAMRAVNKIGNVPHVIWEGSSIDFCKLTAG